MVFNFLPFYDCFKFIYFVQWFLVRTLHHTIDAKYAQQPQQSLGDALI